MLSNRAVFLGNMAQTTPFPLLLEVERAQGVYMYKPDGTRILDLISGIGVSNIGHCHPAVVNAIKQQAETYLHLMVYGELVQSPQTKLAEALTATLPAGLDCVYFVNSGSEAVEGAMKLAKRYTGRSGIVSCYNAYHGSTQGSLSISGGEQYKQAFRPLLPGITQVNFGDMGGLQAITHETAAIIIETVQGEAGLRTASPAYFNALRQRCTHTGTLLILDEIQCGMGRTGTLWAFEQYGIVPDVLLCAKAMGGGMPLGAFIARQEVMHSLSTAPLLGHITTFGGHPVSCAAALAALQVLQKENLVNTVAGKEALFRQLLVHPAIKAIRSSGLMMAVEFESFDILKPVIDRCLENGLLTDWFLFCDNSMRIAPPLTINHDEIRQACGIILEAVAYVTGS